LPEQIADQSPPTFEHSLAELESIVHDLEDGKLGLAEALARYEQGVKHLKHCFALLTQAEQKIELLTAVGEQGEAITEPFVEQGDQASKPARRRVRAKPTKLDGDDLAGLGRDIDD